MAGCKTWKHLLCRGSCGLLLPSPPHSDHNLLHSHTSKSLNAKDSTGDEEFVYRITRSKVHSPTFKNIYISLHGTFKKYQIKISFTVPQVKNEGD